MKKLLVLTTLLLLIYSNVLALPAFPSAEGMGADTIGGRDASSTVYIVDTLSDNTLDGVTFRDAVEASGPRYVVFTVSGRIILNGGLTISNPYLTIAGETSPGGILITGEPVRFLNVHDVIMRHIRVKTGYSTSGNDDAKMDGIQIWGDVGDYNSPDQQYHAYNIIIDHCSVSDTMDELMDSAYTVYDITWSNNLLYGAWRNPPNVNGDAAEGNHNRGPLLWGKFQLSGQDRRQSYLGNVHISLESRMPEVNYHGYLDIRNNIDYDIAGGRSAKVCQIEPGYSMEANFINNYHLPGPTTNSGTGTLNACLAQDDATIYTSGNTGCDISGGNSTWCVGQDDDSNGVVELLAIAKRAPTPFSVTGIEPITSPIPDKAAAQLIIDQAGATKPFRDSDDTNFIECFVNGTSCVFEGARDFDTDLPTYQQLPAPTDTDSDGMPDSWETSFGSNPAVYDPNGFLAGTGYTNLETYLHELAGDAAVTTLTLPADFTSTSPASTTFTASAPDGETITGVVSDVGTANITSGAGTRFVSGIITGIVVTDPSVTITATATSSDASTGLDTQIITLYVAPIPTTPSMKGAVTKGSVLK